MMLQIGEFSRRGRVSVKALRHYEAIGLLKPAHVDAATGYRSYAAGQLDDLHRLMVLRALGPVAGAHPPGAAGRSLARAHAPPAR